MKVFQLVQESEGVGAAAVEPILEVLGQRQVVLDALLLLLQARGVLRRATVDLVLASICGALSTSSILFLDLSLDFLQQSSR